MRTALRMIDPPVKTIKRVEGLREISVVLLNYLRSVPPEFIADRAASALCGYATKPDGDTGWLSVAFSLSDLRREVGRDHFELDDQLIFSALDALTDAGEIRIKTMNLLGQPDIFFRAILAASVRETYFPFSGPTLRAAAWFSSAKDYPGGFIEKPSVVWQSLKAARDRALRERFGSPDLGLESRLHREDILESMRMKRALDAIAARKDQK